MQFPPYQYVTLRKYNYNIKREEMLTSSYAQAWLLKIETEKKTRQHLAAAQNQKSKVLIEATHSGVNWKKTENNERGLIRKKILLLLKQKNIDSVLMGIL